MTFIMGIASIRRDPAQLSLRKSQDTRHSFVHLAIKLSQKSIFWPKTRVAGARVMLPSPQPHPRGVVCMREECSSVIDATEKSLGMVESLQAFQSPHTLTLAEKRLPLFLPENSLGPDLLPLGPFLWV